MTWERFLRELEMERRAKKPAPYIYERPKKTEFQLRAWDQDTTRRRLEDLADSVGIDRSTITTPAVDKHVESSRPGGDSAVASGNKPRDDEPAPVQETAEPETDSDSGGEEQPPIKSPEHEAVLRYEAAVAAALDGDEGSEEQ